MPQAFAANQPPAFVPIAAQSVAENSSLNVAVSATDPRMLYSLFTPATRQNAVFGGSSVVS